MSSHAGVLSFGIGRQLPSIRQAEHSECGLACVAMIASYHGLKTNLASLRLEHSVSARGTTLNSLMALCRGLDLAPRALSVSLDSLDQVELPCILHWQMNHFVVLADVSGDRYVVHDPALGVRTCSKDQVSANFTGVALELTPAPAFKPRDQRRRLRLRDFWTRASGLQGALLQTLVLSAIIQALILATPFYMQLVVDEVLAKFDVDLLVVLALGFGLLVILKELASAVRSWQILYVSSSLDYSMGSNLASHLFRLPMTWFEKRHVGDVISRFSSTQAVRKLFAEGLVASAIDGVMALGALVIMYLYSSQLAFVVIAAVAAYLVTRLAFYQGFRDRTEEEIVARAAQQSALIESLRAMQSVKIFGKEAQRQSIWQNRFAESVNSTVRLGKLTIGFRTVNGFLFGIENIVVIYLGAVAVVEGALTVGMLFAFIAYKRHLIEGAVALIERLIEFRILNVHLDRVADIALSPTESPADLSNLASAGTSTAPEHEFSLSNCRFSFGTDEAPLLDELSLDVTRGEFVTIVGPSGCGKSTLLKLIIGLLDPDQGRILYQGVPVSRIGKSDYRRRFGTVMQEDMLLSGTIAENIAFFDPTPQLDKIHRCAQMAAVHDEIVAMAMGYNNLVGDMGSALSAGQRQRVLLARALYCNPDVLILDEGTAHLDPIIEQAVLTMLSQLDVTRICVTHGDQTIQHSDRILMLHGGQLHELDKDQILGARSQPASTA